MLEDLALFYYFWFGLKGYLPSCMVCAEQVGSALEDFNS